MKKEIVWIKMNRMESGEKVYENLRMDKKLYFLLFIIILLLLLSYKFIINIFIFLYNIIF